MHWKINMTEKNSPQIEILDIAYTDADVQDGSLHTIKAATLTIQGRTSDAQIWRQPATDNTREKHLIRLSTAGTRERSWTPDVVAENTGSSEQNTNQDGRVLVVSGQVMHERTARRPNQYAS